MTCISQFKILVQSAFAEQMAMNLFTLTVTPISAAKSLIYFPKSATEQFLQGGFDCGQASSLLKDMALLDLLMFAHQCNDANKVTILKN